MSNLLEKIAGFGGGIGGGFINKNKKPIKRGLKNIFSDLLRPETTTDIVEKSNKDEYGTFYYPEQIQRSLKFGEKKKNLSFEDRMNIMNMISKKNADYQKSYFSNIGENLKDKKLRNSLKNFDYNRVSPRDARELDSIIRGHSKQNTEGWSDTQTAKTIKKILNAYK